LQVLEVAVAGSLVNEFSKEDAFMSNVRVGIIKCKDIKAVPDVMQPPFDGLNGAALLLSCKRNANMRFVGY